VIDTIKEIIANLVGSEEAGLFELDPGSRCWSWWLPSGSSRCVSPVPLGSGLIGRAATTGEIFVADPAQPPAGPGLEAASRRAFP